MNLFNIIASSFQQSATPSIITDNLEIHYDFTNPACYSGSGNVVQDLTTFNRDLTFVNTPTWNGTYFTFDGANDYGNISNITSVNILGSVGYWIKLTDSLVTSLNQRISGINGSWEFGRLDVGGSAAYSGCTPTTVPQGSIGGDLAGANNTHTNAAFSFTNSVWANLVFTWQVSGAASTYVNGVKVHTCASGNLTRTGTWTVGRSPGNTARYFKGNLGWMTYYTRKLTDAEVLINFEATKSNYGY